MNQLWSFALAAIGILGVYIAGRKSWIGWAIGLGAQVIWIIYALATTQYGFIISAVGYGYFYGLNWWRWTHPQQDETKE